MSLREQKKEHTRLRILEVAEALFRERGYAETPIREIAARLELSPQTLYNYFPSKEGLLTSIFAERQKGLAVAAEEMRVRFLESPDAPGTQVERFLHMIRWGLRALADDRDFMRVVFLHSYAIFGGGLSLEGETVPRDLANPQAANNAVLDRMFESMQKAGELRTDVPPREMTELYTLMFSNRVARWLASDDTDVENLESSVIGSLEILFRGLRVF